MYSITSKKDIYKHNQEITNHLIAEFGEEFFKNNSVLVLKCKHGYIISQIDLPYPKSDKHILIYIYQTCLGNIGVVTEEKIRELVHNYGFKLHSILKSSLVNDDVYCIDLNDTNLRRYMISYEFSKIPTERPKDIIEIEASTSSTSSSEQKSIDMSALWMDQKHIEVDSSSLLLNTVSMSDIGSMSTLHSLIQTQEIKEIQEIPTDKLVNSLDEDKHYINYIGNKSIYVDMIKDEFEEMNLKENKMLSMFYDLVYSECGKKRSVNMIDIRAKAGLYTLFSKFLSNLIVYAYESDKELHERLIHNINLNEIKNVKISGNMLYDTRGKLDLDDKIITTTTIDNVFYHKNQHLDFIRCDTDYNYKILNGGIKTIRKYKPLICIDLKTDKSKIEEFMAMIDYTPYNNVGDIAIYISKRMF